MTQNADEMGAIKSFLDAASLRTGRNQSGAQVFVRKRTRWFDYHAQRYETKGGAYRIHKGGIGVGVGVGAGGGRWAWTLGVGGVTPASITFRILREPSSSAFPR